MSEIEASLHQPDEPPAVPAAGTGGTVGHSSEWQGPTYYGRPALKEAPFNNWVVGGYVFLAGLAGSASILALIADATRGQEAAGAVRRGRYLTLLAPTVGSALLVWDLHTPQRFYNMFRVAKRTSPMSIGTWILTGFSLTGGLTAGLQFLADRRPRPWGRRAARAANVPAAVLGGGMGTYTAALLAATSTPLWAAAPAALATHFGASSMASGAAALSLGEAEGPTRRILDGVTCAALAVELAAGGAQAAAYRRSGVAGAMRGGWGLTEKVGVTGLGTAVPLALHALSLADGGRGNLSRLASLLVLGGSLLLRVSTMAAGDKSARKPEISFRFAQPDNLTKPRSSRDRHKTGARRSTPRRLGRLPKEKS